MPTFTAHPLLIRRGFAPAILIGLLLMVLAACSSPAASSAPDGSAASNGSATVPTATLPDSPFTPAGVAETCDLLTADEIGGVVGNPVAAGVPDDVFGCGWNADPMETSVIMTDVEVAQAACSEAFEAEGEVAVDGLAAPAFWGFEDIGGGAGTLSICRDSRMLAVGIVAGLRDESDDAALRAQAEALAALALGRL